MSQRPKRLLSNFDVVARQNTLMASLTPRTYRITAKPEYFSVCAEALQKLVTVFKPLWRKDFG